jgi:hypothetical protein
MALPNLNHKNVVRYFGCWAERIDMANQAKIDARVAKIKRKLEQNRRNSKCYRDIIKETKRSS